MKKYVIQQDGKEYSILERDTDHVLYKKIPLQTARQRVGYLNGGKGFRGWTPRFIVKSIDRYKNEQSS